MRRLLPLLLALPLGGCLSLPTLEEPIYSACHAIASGDWTAQVEKRPVTMHHPPIRKWRLIVDGTVTVPGDGYDVSLEPGPVQKLKDPVQQIMIRTNGGGAGAPTKVAVHGEFEALKRYGAVTLRCGDGTLAILRDVPRIPS
jgi:hypothetical protein